MVTPSQAGFPAAACRPLAATQKPFETVHESFEAQVERTPDSVAVEYGEQTPTYRELDVRAQQLAARLHSLGVEVDSRVGICVGRSFDLPVAVLAVLKAGGAYVPLDPRFPADRLSFMMEDAGASVLLTQTPLAEMLPLRTKHTILLDTLKWTGTETAKIQPSKRRPTGESLAYVIYTSGSTGKPKGVAMVHRALANLIDWQARQSAHLPSGARTLQFTSLSFDVSFQEIFSTWHSGGVLVLMPEELRYDPVGLWGCLRERRIHRLFLPFVSLQQLAEAAVESHELPPTLRDIITAGEQLQITPAIRAMFRRLPNARLHNHYGPSETHVATAYALPAEPDSWTHLPPIGRPIANAYVRVLDGQGLPATEGEPGELFIGGDCLARGYLNRTDLTEQRFVADPFDGAPGARLYRTGDRVRRLPDGNLEFLGRMDDQIKIRGYRVEPGEIEAVLAQHPAVRACAVTAHGEGGEKQLAAYVVAVRGPQPAPESLRDFLRDKLADYMVPAHYVLLEKLPLTPSGKVDRRALPKPNAEEASSAALVSAPPCGALEISIAGIWSDILRRPTVGALDNFFDLGGTSLMVTHVQRRMRTDLGRDVPIALLFQAPTLRDLATRLGNKPEDAMQRQDAIVDRAARQREAAARRRTLMRPKAP